MIDIDELRRLTQEVSGWSNCNQAWLDQSEDVPAAVVGHIDEDGNTYPIATIDCDQYYAANQSLPLAKFYAAANPAAVSEILDRLEAAEKERDALRAKVEGVEDERIIDERRIADLMADLNRVGHENDALRAKIEAMEKQKPVAEWVDSTFDQYPYLRWREPYKAIAGAKLYTKFYALPGAQGEEK